MYPQLEVDVMNPHYGDYYQGKEKSNKPVPPADYLNPNPIPFLTVGKDTKFEFTVGMKKLKQAREILKNGSSRLISECEGLTVEKKLHEIAISWLKKALTQHGIGAKTAVGYGYFEKT
ncbi:type III-B CRISPR module RAMP protein Cmr6 [Dissulfurispira thermophila]|nr:type III-B CRISPR module RAMP protein Cmr6 [Dissulfurispira thermophila]